MTSASSVAGSSSSAAPLILPRARPAFASSDVPLVARLPILQSQSGVLVAVAGLSADPCAIVVVRVSGETRPLMDPGIAGNMGNLTFGDHLILLAFYLNSEFVARRVRKALLFVVLAGGVIQ